MTDSSPQTPPAQLFADDELLAFTSVPMDRRRSNGWTPAQQERFIRARDVMGSVGQAAMAVGMSRTSACNLQARMLRAFDCLPYKYYSLSMRCKYHYARTIVAGQFSLRDLCHFGRPLGKLYVKFKGKLW